MNTNTAIRPATIHDFPTIAAYVGGGLPTIWQQRTAIITRSDQQLSPIRAGELAAVELARAYGIEADQLEQLVRVVDAPNTNALYDAWVTALEAQTVRGLLIELSGIRTLAIEE